MVKIKTNDINTVGSSSGQVLKVSGGSVAWTSLVKADVGLSNVDNTSDANKPISTATQTALDLKASTSSLATVATSGLFSDLGSKPTTLSGYGITDAQPLDADLTAIAGLTGTTGLLKKTSANTWSLDTNIYLTTITSTDVTTALGYIPEDSANKGQASGYASLDGSGKVPSAQLPSYVDDVVEYSDYASLPGTGETGKIYLTLDDNKIYRWSGTVYIEIAGSVGTTDNLTEGSTNLYFTSARARSSISVTQNLTYDSGTGIITGPDLSGYLTTSSASSTYAPINNPTFTGTVGGITKSMVGLSNVDNTSDANKPVSTATQTALDLKADISSLAVVATSGLLEDLNNLLITSPADGDSLIYNSTSSKWENAPATGSGATNLDGLTDVVLTSPTSGQFFKYDGTHWINYTITKSDVGLSNVDNTSDVNKPVSTATQTALDGKEDSIAAGSVNQYWRGDKTWQTLDKTAVGLTNVDNTSDASKPISTATQTALDGKETTITSGTTGQYWRGDKSWQSLNKSAVGLGNVDNTSDANKPVSTAQQSALDLKADITSLADVAISGSYNDLTDKPTIPTHLYDLTDTNIATPASGQVLTYDGGTSKWVNTDASTIAATQLDQLSDVVLTSPATAEVLQYNGTEWVNSPVAYSEVTGTPSLATVATTGAYSDLTGKPSLATVATTGAFSDLTGKPTTLSGYGITDAVNTSALGANSGVATLDSSGKLLTTQLPALAITSVQTAASQSAQLALTTQEGDVVVRTDEVKTYIKNSGTAGTMADFTEILTPSSSVISVNGQTGVVVLTKSDISLGNVDNTSDANKPVSTATQTALDLKADISSLATVATTGAYSDLTGTPSLATVATTGAYSDLTGKPTIPTNLDSLTDVTITSASTDQVLQYNGSGWVNATFTPGASTLDDLTDVVITSVADGDVVTWDSATSKWVNLPNTGGGGSSNLDGLTDVVITSPSNTQILQYNGTNWVNAARPIDVPSGGTTGQVLRKASNTNYDFEYHSLVKGDVGLGNVDNTADTDKPISTATQSALDAKEPTITAGTTGQYWRGDKSWQTLDKTAVGLANVDNTADTAKPVSTAQQAALDLKLNLAGGTMTGDITLGVHKITTTATSWATNELVPKTYVDSAISGFTVTNSNLTPMATMTIKGNNTGSTAVPSDLTVSQVKTMLNLTGTNSGDQTITLTGDVTGSGTGSFATTLANTAVTPGSYTLASITVDSKGRITSASSGSVSASSLTGTTLASNVVSSSLTSVGTLGSLDVTGAISAGSFSGDGSSLTGISAQTISNGTSSVTIPVAGGDIKFNPSGVSDVLVVSSTGITTNGNLTATGNIVSGSGTGGSITGANLVSANSLQGTITTAAQPNITSVGTLTSLTTSGTITQTGGFVILSSSTGLAGTGSIQADALLLTSQLNVMATVSSGTGVILPTAAVGNRITIVNTTGTALNVYPDSGSAINALSTNVAYSLAAGAIMDFIAISTTLWFTK